MNPVANLPDITALLADFPQEDMDRALMVGQLVWSHDQKDCGKITSSLGIGPDMNGKTIHRVVVKILTNPRKTYRKLGQFYLWNLAQTPGAWLALG